jgi:hypothetical protein
MITRRYLFWMIACAVLGRKLFAELHLPIVDDLRDLPPGVPGLLRFDFAAQFANALGVPMKPDHQPVWYYISAMDNKVLCLIVPDYETGKPAAIPWMKSPYPEFEKKLLIEHLSGVQTKNRTQWVKLPE